MTERVHFNFSHSCIGEGNGNPLQCSCLENPRDGEAWWAAVYGVAQSRTRLKRLSSSSSSSRITLGLPWWLSDNESTYQCRSSIGQRGRGKKQSKSKELSFPKSVFPCGLGDSGSIPGSGRSQQKEMATHSSILAWKIPWTQEPGGLRSMVLQRFGYDWAVAHQCRRPGFDHWVRKIPWRGKWQPTSVVLHGKFHGPRTLAGYSLQGCKNVGHDLATKQQ